MSSCERTSPREEEPRRQRALLLCGAKLWHIKALHAHGQGASPCARKKERTSHNIVEESQKNRKKKRECGENQLEDYTKYLEI